MFTDIVGYTAKIGKNKKETFALLNKYKERVIAIPLRLEGLIAHKTF